jgi:hypothetical protein
MVEEKLYDDLKLMLNDLIPELNKLTIEYMTQAGVPKSSNLVKSVGFEVKQGKLGLVANNYWYYVSQGRRRGAAKVPITALIDYCKRYGIVPRQGQTLTQLAFAIQTAIYRRGINPKNYDEKVIDATSDVTEETLADDISTTVADEILAEITASPYSKQI